MTPPRTHHSLKIRLLRLLFIPLLLGMAAIGTASYLGAHHETQEVYDAQLVHFARALHQLTRDHQPENTLAAQPPAEHPTARHRYEKHIRYRVWQHDRIILQSAGGTLPGDLPSADGFVDRTLDGRRWRSVVFRQDDITIEVAEEYEVRMDLIRHVLSGIFLPQLLLVPLLMVVIWLGVQRGLLPLNRLSDLIRTRRTDSLLPIQPIVVPLEAVPLVRAINDLIARMTQMLEKEKDFSNLAAHQLRTPLAALKTQLQVALRESDPHMQRNLFCEALGSIDRMTHLVTQLLTFARMQASGTMPPHEAVMLAPLLQSLADDYAATAAQQHLRIQLHIAESSQDAVTTGDASWLRILLDTLMDNAIAYSPADTTITLSLQPHPDGWCINVADQGHGIPAGDLPHIFDRFYRAKTAHQHGAGLGLAIARQIAQIHGIALSAHSEGAGHGSRFAVVLAATS